MGKYSYSIASKHCANKPLSKANFSVFKLIQNQTENFHKKSKFLSNYNKFWVLQNCDPVISIIENINKRSKAKSISTYDFSTLYTKIPHDSLLERLFRIVDFVFEGGNRNFIRFSRKGEAYWHPSKSKKDPYFSKGSLKIAIRHLIENCFFTVGDIVMRQSIGIPMGIDPAPFWANLFLYTYEEEYIYLN